jgi:hypothetical protein
MPPDDFTLTLDTANYKTFTMNYYLQVLDGDPSNDSYGGKQYKLDNTIKAIYNHITKAEDFFDIGGFVQAGSNPAFDRNDQITTSGNALTVNFYYDRITDHYLRFIYRVNYLESSLYYALEDGGLFEYSAKNYPDFIDYVLEGVHYARTVHVYIPNESQADEQKNYEIAKQIADELAACTDDEERYALMCRHIGSSVNKDLQITEAGYYFTHNEMGEEYENAAFGLSDYQVSDVVEYSGAYYVIMRLPIEELYVLRHGEELLQYYQSAQLGAYEDNVMENLTLELNEYGLSLDLTTIK